MFSFNLSVIPKYMNEHPTLPTSLFYSLIEFFHHMFSFFVSVILKYMNEHPPQNQVSLCYFFYRIFFTKCSPFFLSGLTSTTNQINIAAPFSVLFHSKTFPQSRTPILLIVFFIFCSFFFLFTFNKHIKQ